MYPTTTPGPADYSNFPAPVYPPTPPRRSRRGPVAAIIGTVVGLLAVAAAALVFFGVFTGSVPKADVAAAISTQLASREITATTVDCPQDLPAKVGESVRCTYTVDGKAVGVTAKVTSLQGDQAVYEITSEAPLVTEEDVQNAIDGYAKKLNYTTDGAPTCPSALIGEPGRSVRCEFSVGGQPVDAVATVSSATADKARFDIALQARAVDQQTVEADVAYLVQREAGVQVDGVDCAGGLDPQVGDSVVCTVSGSGEQLDVRVAVSSVDGGLVDYDLQPA